MKHAHFAAVANGRQQCPSDYRQAAKPTGRFLGGIAKNHGGKGPNTPGQVNCQNRAGGVPHILKSSPR